MDEKSTPPEKEEIAGALRGQLVKRLAVAAGLVAVLLGVLAVFDRLASNGDDFESPVFTQPVPVAPKKEITQPVTAATNLPEPPAPPAPPVAEPAPPTPQIEVPAVVPEMMAEKKAGVRQENRPPARSTATEQNLPTLAPADRAPRQQALPATIQRAPIAESTATPRISPEPAVPDERVASKPAARITEVRSTPGNTQPSSVQRLFSGFLLQAGVFTSAQRAEELHAKLTLSGVPSTLETRVQVGPFRTRQEAEAAQEKLRQLGVESLLVPPKGAKN